MSGGSLRLLFASVHGHLDPSSGAATATRDILELLAGLGHDCRALTTGVLDYHVETPLEPLLADLGLAAREADAAAGPGAEVRVLDLEHGGVRATILPTASSRLDRSPDRAESAAFLGLVGRVLERFRPDALLTYGGHAAVRELMRMARGLGIPVVFHLHNFAYDDRVAFADATRVLVPSEYSRRYHARTLEIDCDAIPLPVRPERALASDPEPRYLTFVNPVPVKGLTVFARIALELGRRRPEVPILVVEGRGSAGWLGRVPLDLSGLENLHRMANTPDPRAIYRVSRAVLVPSLWRESFGRVAAEALANGLPVLASDRGALPETLGDAGFLFTPPARCTPESIAVPTAQEVEPWVRTIERLWDEPSWESDQRERAWGEATRWEPGPLAERFAAYFSGLHGPGGP